MTNSESRFRELLEKSYLFPTTYLHKFIGRDSGEFHASVSIFEQKFVGLKRTKENRSASGKHIAYTYEFIAAKPDDILELTRETSQLKDLMYIL